MPVREISILKGCARNPDSGVRQSIQPTLEETSLWFHTLGCHNNLSWDTYEGMSGILTVSGILTGGSEAIANMMMSYATNGTAVANNGNPSRSDPGGRNFYF